MIWSAGHSYEQNGMAEVNSMKNFLEEFRRFCAKGNVLELATGVMIGGAFSSIVNSLVNDILMPLIGLLTGAWT